MANKNMFLEDYTFKGNQCEMVNKLTQKIDIESNSTIFSTAIDLFIYSALVGCIFNLKKKPSKDSTKTTKIFATQFVTHASDLRMAFKFVLLTSNCEFEDDAKRLNKTFRNPETDENYQLFEEYMLGGLEEIYNRLIVDSNTRYEDYLATVNNFMSSFNIVEESDTDSITTDNFDF